MSSSPTPSGTSSELAFRIDSPPRRRANASRQVGMQSPQSQPLLSSSSVYTRAQLHGMNFHQRTRAYRVCPITHTHTHTHQPGITIPAKIYRASNTVRTDERCLTGIMPRLTMAGHHMCSWQQFHSVKLRYGVGGDQCELGHRRRA